jgi:chitinase
LSTKLKRQTATIWVLWVTAVAVFALTSTAQAANYYAVGEIPVVGTKGASGKWGGNYTSTHTADGIGQQLTETNAAGTMRLVWTYQFGGWSTEQTLTALAIKGYAVNNRGNNEAIDVYFSANIQPDPNSEGDWSKIGTISSTASSNAQTFSLPNVPMGASRVFHVRVVDSLRTNDTVSNSYRIDQIYVTGQDVAPPGGDPPSPTGPATTKEIIGYFTQWGIYGKGQSPKLTASGIPADKVTIVNYAFLNLDALGNVFSGDEFADYNHTKDPIYLERGNFAQLRALRRDYPHLKLVFSVGGWTWSKNFSVAASSPEGRDNFATTLVRFVEVEDFDGADIDWEYPTGDPTVGVGEAGNTWDPKDPINHALLLLAVRAKLDELSVRTGKNYILSIATPAGYQTMAKVLPPLVNNHTMVNGFKVDGNEFLAGKYVGAMTAAQALRFVNVMCYDMAGAGWSQLSRHHAPLFAHQIVPGELGDPGDPNSSSGSGAEHWRRHNCHFALQGHRVVFTDYSHLDGLFGLLGSASNPPPPVGGFSDSQLVFGVATYGRGFARVTGGFNGLFGTHSGQNNGSATEPVWFYTDILNKAGTVYRPGDNTQADPLGSPPPWTVYGAYKFDGTQFIGFDDVRLIKQKVRYLADNNLGGMMVWEFRFDSSVANDSLIHAMKLGLESLAPR